MEQDETPTDDDRNYADECGDHGGSNRNDEPCGRPAGWGTDFDSGKCRQHRGTSPDGSSHEGNDWAEGNEGGGAEEGNTNAVKHGAYADEHAFYSEVATDVERKIIDDVFVDYVEKYKTRHGEPGYSDKVELFFCAVTIGKEIHGENWAVDRPEDLDSGNVLVASEENYTDEGTRYVKYKKTVIQSATKELEGRRRKWLKDMGLLESPEGEVAGAVGNLASAISDNFS